MRHFLLLISFAPIISIAQPSDSWDAEKIEIKQGDNQNIILSAEMIYDEGWDELAQTIFWKQIMQLSSDSCLVSIGSTREIIKKTSLATWNSQTKAEKASFRDSIKKLHELPQDAHVYVTSGKSDFYKFQVVYPSISEGVAAFERFEVDPWYAQAILLIESPGQLKKSRAGAYGPFQLMPAVARAQGLTVNRYTDERKDFERSAYGASRLIHRVCIPEAKRILNARNLAFDENDLWFRLFVLHVYHAGAGNVSAVIAKINPSEGGQSLIRSMWVNSAAQFGNNSQNYTQLALASQLILDEMVHENYDYILRCSVD